MPNVRIFGETEFWFALIRVTTIAPFIAVVIAAIVPGLHAGTVSNGDAITAGAYNILGDGGFFPGGFPIIFVLTVGEVFTFGGTQMAGVCAPMSAASFRPRFLTPHCSGSMPARPSPGAPSRSS
ncbi:hypothetical protein [Actinomyces johnsonii]|uniref:hypothetical protein n=1 Tax=Actinomyces johnsonii TaxID=544581 RepID=UPI0036F2E51C